jgi:hypothetical protein
MICRIGDQKRMYFIEIGQLGFRGPDGAGTFTKDETMVCRREDSEMNRRLVSVWSPTLAAGERQPHDQ